MIQALHVAFDVAFAVAFAVAFDVAFAVAFCSLSLRVYAARAACAKHATLAGLCRSMLHVVPLSVVAALFIIRKFTLGCYCLLLLPAAAGRGTAIIGLAHVAVKRLSLASRRMMRTSLKDMKSTTLTPANRKLFIKMVQQS